jgi:hypothetical protein
LPLFLLLRALMSGGKGWDKQSKIKSPYLRAPWGLQGPHSSCCAQCGTSGFLKHWNMTETSYWKKNLRGQSLCSWRWQLQVAGTMDLSCTSVDTGTGWSETRADPESRVVRGKSKSFFWRTCEDIVWGVCAWE